MQHPSDERLTISVVEAGARLGIGRDLSYQLARTGRLPGAMRLGRLWRVSRPVLERALTEGWQPASELGEAPPATGPRP